MDSRKVVGGVQWIYQLLMINICFFITNFPLMVAFILLIPSLKSLPFYLLASITFGPSLVAVGQTLSVLREKRELAFFSTFFSYWRSAFKLSASLTLLFEAFVVIGIADLVFFSRLTGLTWLNPLVALLLFLGLLVYANSLYLVISGKITSLISLIKESFVLGLAKWYISLLSGLLLIVLVLAMIVKPAFGFLVFPALIMALFLWNSQKIKPV